MATLAINTDLVHSTGSPRNILHAIAHAGFTHLHWCHHWCTDFLYGEHELNQIREWLQETHLRLLDIHGSAGQEKCWYATEEYQRLAGVELVRNRLRMMRELRGTGALMMHIPFRAIHRPADPQRLRRQVDALKRSLDDIMPTLDQYDQRIAVENLWGDTWEVMDEILASYPANRIGICYDSGHANAIQLPQMAALAKRKDRLMALHLHDNDQQGDLHQPPFMGTVDWQTLANIIATSAYRGPLSFELSIRNTPFAPADPQQEPSPEAISDFLADAFQRCLEVQKLLDNAATGN